MGDPNLEERALKRKLIWLYGDVNRCRCEHAWVSAGRVDHIDMGHQWARTTTHPSCPEHAKRKVAR